MQMQLQLAPMLKPSENFYQLWSQLWHNVDKFNCSALCNFENF